MKIEFTESKELVDLSRTVKPGAVLESPKDAPEELLQAYVNNGIAIDVGARACPALDAIGSNVAKESQQRAGQDRAPTESATDAQNTAGGE